MLQIGQKAYCRFFRRSLATPLSPFAYNHWQLRPRGDVLTTDGQRHGTGRVKAGVPALRANEAVYQQVLSSRKGAHSPCSP